MIRYYRTTPGPHWVQMDALAFGDDVPAEKRRELKPGRCDGHNPAYTEAFDLAGIRAVASLARALDKSEDAVEYEAFAAELFAKLRPHLWLETAGQVRQLLRALALPVVSVRHRARRTSSSKVSGRRSRRAGGTSRWPGRIRACWRAIARRAIARSNLHLDQPQMQRWYAFDEGGKSGSGGWGHLRTTWNGSVAMPHGWAIAEVHLLLRDCLAYEDDGRLVLFAGVPVRLVHRPRRA